jgi:hypothetical protein
MNNKKYISIYFNAFAKRVENDILMDAFNGNIFDFSLSARYDDRYSTERLKQLDKDMEFIFPLRYHSLPSWVPYQLYYRDH